jgi:hypothetical protein
VTERAHKSTRGSWLWADEMARVILEDTVIEPSSPSRFSTPRKLRFRGDPDLLTG